MFFCTGQYVIFSLKKYILFFEIYLSSGKLNYVNFSYIVPGGAQFLTGVPIRGVGRLQINFILNGDENIL